MDRPSDDEICMEYASAVAKALDDVSLKYGARGDMGAALAALCAIQADMIGQLPDGRLRKTMRLDCGKKLLHYLTVRMGDDKRGVSKEALPVLPPRVH